MPPPEYLLEWLAALKLAPPTAPLTSVVLLHSCINFSFYISKNVSNHLTRALRTWSSNYNEEEKRCYILEIPRSFYRTRPRPPERSWSRSAERYRSWPSGWCRSRPIIWQKFQSISKPASPYFLLLWFINTRLRTSPLTSVPCSCCVSGNTACLWIVNVI